MLLCKYINHLSFLDRSEYGYLRACCIIAGPSLVQIKTASRAIIAEISSTDAAIVVVGTLVPNSAVEKVAQLRAVGAACCD